MIDCRSAVWQATLNTLRRYSSASWSHEREHASNIRSPYITAADLKTSVSQVTGRSSDQLSVQLEEQYSSFKYNTEDSRLRRKRKRKRKKMKSSQSQIFTVPNLIKAMNEWMNEWMPSQRNWRIFWNIVTVTANFLAWKKWDIFSFRNLFEVNESRQIVIY